MALRPCLPAGLPLSFSILNIPERGWNRQDGWPDDKKKQIEFLG
jgi:hypothetical protein